MTIDYDSISSGQQDIAVTGSGATGLDVRADQLAGAGMGIALSAVAGGTISGNDISTGTIGLSITAALTGVISANIIHNAQTGVSYQAAAALSDNSIHDNATGVVSNVAAVASALGFVGSTQPDQIFDNSTGVQFNNATMQNQHVYDNALGVSGSGVLGGSDLNYANLIEANTVAVAFSGTIQYNRITRETVGIEAQSGQLIAYNLLYRNTQAAIDVNGQSAVHIVNNTFYAPSGDNMDIHGGSSEVECSNNILWAQSGYDINVAYDSQNGYFSDYNDLYASGTGILVHWDINFTDILDWQDDVAQFDLHSEGTTILNPTLDRPRFAGLTVDDFQVIAPFAGVRNSSPTVNAGDPVTDEDLPASFQNLLTNPGFESGLTGWTASPSGGTQMPARRRSRAAATSSPVPTPWLRSIRPSASRPPGSRPPRSTPATRSWSSAGGSAPADKAPDGFRLDQPDLLRRQRQRDLHDDRQRRQPQQPLGTGGQPHRHSRGGQHRPLPFIAVRNSGPTNESYWMGHSSMCSPTPSPWTRAPTATPTCRARPATGAGATAHQPRSVHELAGKRAPAHPMGIAGQRQRHAGAHRSLPGRAQRAAVPLEHHSFHARHGRVRLDRGQQRHRLRHLRAADPNLPGR